MKNLRYLLMESPSQKMNGYDDERENDYANENFRFDVTSVNTKHLKSKKRKVKIKYSIVFIMLFCACFIANAQGKNMLINGIVTDEYGPLAGVIVQIKGTSKYVFTDHNGKFTIEAPPESTALVFSMLGMVSQEVSISSGTYLDIYMEYDERYSSPEQLSSGNRHF